jgi:hypothetical protein
VSVYTRPYFWCIPENFPNSLILNYRWRERKTNRFIFGFGQRLPWDSGNPNLSFTLQDPKDYDLVLHATRPPEKWLQYGCLPNNAGSPIVNDRVLALLSVHCSNDFQAFPVVIKNENPRLPDFENHDYHLLNITHCVEAIDREKSIIKYYPNGKIDDLKVLFLKENCLGEHHLARVKDYTPKIVVSSELLKLFKKEKVKGVRFMTDEEWFNALWTRMPSAD